MQNEWDTLDDRLEELCRSVEQKYEQMHRARMAALFRGAGLALLAILASALVAALGAG